MTTSTQTQLRRGTSSQIAAMTPAIGEVVVNTTTKRLHLGDGLTPGGIPQGTSSPNTYQSTPSNPTGTANTTGVMMGLAGSFTPSSSGSLLVTICGVISNTVSACGGRYQITYGTGTAPSNGDALTGTGAGPQPSAVLFPTPNYHTPFSVTTVITGLTVGVAHWIDLSLAAVNGGTASVSGIGVTLVEVH